MDIDFNDTDLDTWLSNYGIDDLRHSFRNQITSVPQLLDTDQSILSALIDNENKLERLMQVINMNLTTSINNTYSNDMISQNNNHSPPMINQYNDDYISFFKDDNDIDGDFKMNNDNKDNADDDIKMDVEVIDNNINKKPATRDEIESLKKLNQKKSHIDQLCEQLHEILDQKQLNQALYKTTQEINSYFSHIEEQLKVRKQELCDQLIEDVQSKTNVLQEQLSNVETYKLILSQHQSQCEQTMNDSSISIPQRKTAIIEETQNILKQSCSMALNTEPRVKFKRDNKTLGAFLAGLSIDTCDRPEFREFNEVKQDDIAERLYRIDPEYGRGAMKSIHLVLPNDCSIDRNGNCIKDTTKQRQSFVINPEALEIIRNIKGPVGVVSITGRARSGKSYVMGKLVGQQIFALGHKMTPETMGIWMAQEPFEIRKTFDGKQQKLNIICLDTEGIFAVDRGASLDFDNKIVQLSILVSSYFIYNHKYDGLQHDIDFVHLVIEFAANILEQEKNLYNYDDDIQPFYMPDFLWLMRDLTLDPPKNDDGTNMSIRDYMMNCVLNAPIQSLKPSDRNKRQIRERILRFFYSFDAEGLVPPHADTQIMKHIGDDAYEHLLVDEFVNGVKNMVDRIRKTVRPKRSINGQVFTGPELALWIETIVHALNTGKQPELGSTWKRVIEKKYRDIKKMCVDNYKQLMVIENMPISQEKINEYHNEIIKNQITQQFTRDTQGVFDKTFAEQYLNELFLDCNNYLKNILIENENESRKFCINLTKQLELEYLYWLNDPKTLDTNINFKDLQDKFENAKATYGYRARGPCRDIIWVTFEADVIKRINTLKAHWHTIKEFDTKTQQQMIELQHLGQTNKKMMNEMENQRRKMDAKRRELQSKQQVISTLHDQMEASKNRINTLNSQMAQQSEKQKREIQETMKMYENFKDNALRQKQQYEQENKQNINRMNDLNQQIANLARRPPRVQHVHHHHRGGGGGCFGGNNTCYRKKTILNEIEKCYIKEIKLGDWVLTEDGTFQSTIHVDHFNEYDMVCIQYQNVDGDKSGSIVMTDHHYIYIEDINDDELQCIMSKYVKIGDILKYLELFDDENNKIKIERVKIINIEKCRDIASTVMTTNGSLIVSNIRASCFTSNTINLKQYLWIGQFLVDYAPIKCAQIVSSCFYYTNKYSKWLINKYNDYIAY